MENRLNIPVSFYKTVTVARPLDVNLWDLLTGDAYRSEITAIRKERDLKRQKALKDRLPAYTVSGTFSASNDESLIEHTGLLCIDVDADANTGLTGFDRFKESIAACPYVLYAGLSCRGAGYMLIVPITRPDKHREHFDSLEQYFAAAGVVIDTSCKNISRKRFVSYDPEPYVNLNAETYDYVIEPQRKKPRRRNARRPSGKTAAEVQRIVSVIYERGIDITGGYQSWFEIGCALAHEFGEDGRQWFHDVSQFGDYDPDYTDRKFDEALKVNGYSIASFFHYAKFHGIGIHAKTTDPVAEAREVFKEYIKRKQADGKRRYTRQGISRG